MEFTNWSLKCFCDWRDLIGLMTKHDSAQWGPRRALSSLFILQVKLSSLMSKLPARYQTMNSERKNLKSFITDEREAFKVEFQMCQLLFEWKSLLIATYFWTYFWWNILELLFWYIGICSLCIVSSELAISTFMLSIYRELYFSSDWLWWARIVVTEVGISVHCLPPEFILLYCHFVVL